jgi:hypothetical protein
MSTPTIKQPSNDSAGNAESVSGPVTINHDAGEFTTTAPVVTAATSQDQQFFQVMPAHDLNNFMSRFVELNTWVLAGDDSSMDILDKFDPWDLFLSKLTVQDKLANYTFFRGTLELTFSVVVTPFTYGAYCVSALPVGMEESTGTATQTLEGDNTLFPENMMQVDHWAMIDCAASENVVMQLPWLWPYDWDTISNKAANMWQVNLCCIQAIKSALDASDGSGYIKCFGRLLPGYELAIPRFQGLRGGHLVQSEATHKHMPKEHAKLAKPKHKVSDVANTIGDVASKLTGIPVIGGMAATAATAAHTVGKLASIFGFSRDSDEQTPSVMMMRSVSNVAHTEGSDPSAFASFTLAPEITIDPTLVGGPSEDPASFASLFSRWTYVATFDWNTTNASGDLLATFPVSPFYSTAGNLNSAGHGLSLPVAGYVGLPFSYWRGDMEYRFIIPTGKPHRGTLQVFWQTTDAAVPDDVTNITLNTIMDVTTGSHHDFTVGFAREKPYLRTYMLDDQIIIQPVAAAANGRIRIRVINPLVAPSSTAGTSIYVFARAKENMRFSVPRNTLDYPYPPSGEEGYQVYDWTTAIWQLQGADGDEEIREAVSHVLVPPTPVYPASELFFGEDISSVRALLQKPSRWLWPLNEDGTPIGPFPQMAVPQLGFLCKPDYVTFDAELQANCDTTCAFQSPFTWQGWYRVLFAGIACSERYKFFSNNLGWYSAAPSVLGVLGWDSQSRFPETLAPVTANGPAYGAECTVPYFNPRKFLKGRTFYATADNSSGHTTTNERFNTLMLNLFNDSPDTQSVIYHSYGPDIRLTTFYQVPRIVSTAAKMAPTAYVKRQSTCFPQIHEFS